MIKKSKLLGFVFGLLMSSIVVADSISLNPNHPNEYVVVKGDTLWDISGKFLQNPWQWPEIWNSNPQIKNPHLIYPGDVISLINDGSGPRLHIRRKNSRLVKLSPHTRITKLENAIPTIPIDSIKQFLSRPTIVDKDTLNNSPYIVAFEEERIVGGTGHKTYVRKIENEETKNFTIYRDGNTYSDPETGEVLGYEAIYVGDAQLSETGDPATLKITRSTREVLRGDRLLVRHDKDAFDQNFMPKKPTSSIRASILAVLNGLTQIGQYNVITLSKGSDDGVEVGHVLAISQSGRIIRDTITKKVENIALPENTAGYVMVFRTFNQISYALVMNSTSNISVNDIVHTP
jgi:LysM repeat protein